jgi:hypothetical protein
MRKLAILAALLLIPAIYTMRKRGMAPADQPSAWVLDETGLGPVQIGMPIAAVAKALGQPFAAPSIAGRCVFATWEGAPAGVKVDVTAGIVQRVIVESNAVHTDIGAGVGDDEKRVMALYRPTNGELERSSPALPHLLLANAQRAGGPPLAISFDIDTTGHVRTLSAGYASRLAQPANCPG